MSSSLRILVIDDSLTAREKFKEFLEADGAGVLLAKDAEQGAELLRSENPDCLLLDYRLPGVSGLEFLSQLSADDNGLPLPVVMLTGEGNESVAVEAMKAGVHDYLVKGAITQHNLLRAVQNAIEKVATERELLARNERIEQLTQELTEANCRLTLMSRLDPLTKLFNRAAFEESVTLEHERFVQYGRVYSVIMLDVDHFKLFNDSLGHQAGDACLQRIAQCLNKATKSMDVVGRYGGEEFIVLAPETELQGAPVLAERIREEVCELDIRHPASPTAESVTVSLGIAQDPAERWEEVVKKADQALYAAKRNGRNRVCVHQAESYSVADPAECEVSP